MAARLKAQVKQIAGTRPSGDSAATRLIALTTDLGRSLGLGGAGGLAGWGVAPVGGEASGGIH